MCEYALIMIKMVNYARIYLKKTVLNMNTVKSFKMERLHKVGDGGGVELWTFDKGTLHNHGLSLQIHGTFFDFQKGQGRLPLCFLVHQMKVCLNFHQYLWIFQSILENVRINSSDDDRALNIHDHLTCLTGFWRCLRF